MRRIFGTSRQNFTSDFIYYGNHHATEHNIVDITWYNARESHPNRTEYRLYYSENEVVRLANISDLLVVGKRNDDSIVVLIIKNGSASYRLYMSLFGMISVTNQFVICNNIVT